MKNYLTNYSGKDIFDAFDNLFKFMFLDETRDMRTDIKETNDSYQLDIEMPGFKKEQICVSLEDGYLNVRAEKKTENKEEKGKKYLRKEISETYQRSYYVGNDVQEENIKAKYENGILILSVPKPQAKQLPSHSITIE